MPRTAQYVAVQDGSTTLSHDGDIDHTFLRFDAPDASVTRRPVLSFVVNPSGSVTLQMKLNGTIIVNEPFSGGAKAWQEIVESNLLLAEDNELIAELTDTDGAGSITVRDVSLLYMNA
jgi:hypothetical protein